ncbi:hypothetical protein NHQ30_010378 [Ciborinia camelliae]|nr:hypothetical protein NHQ30_010378 [Ciborinia camelliae]
MSSRNPRWQINVAGSETIEYILPFNIGELEVSSRTCVFCSLIKNGVEATCRDGDLFYHEYNNSIEKHGRIIVQKSAPFEIELIHDKYGTKEEMTTRLQFFAASNDDEDGEIRLGSGPGYFGALGIAKNVPTLISLNTHINLINSWINNCIQNHSSCNISSTTQLPSRLLDISGSPDLVHLVQTRNLPSGSKSPSYATLSHCWGSKRFIQTTSSSIASFYNGIRRDALPANFRDAISVVQALGLRFIWIDSLCIIQDSSEDWRHESALMASIYSNSYVNIAATGAADSSRGCLAPRNLAHRSIPISARGFLKTQHEDNIIFVRKSLNGLHKLYSTPAILRSETTDLSEKEKEAPLLLRAWVFQERYLAPRTLHFCSSELVMECRQGLRCECTGLDSIASNPLCDVEDVSYDSWLRVVEEFSRLRLSYETDRLIALMGVAKVFHARLMSTYLQGIWAEDLARGLLWDITRYESYQASASSCSSSPKRQSKEVAPTWSWASIVMTEGMGIVFSAAHDASFSRNPRFALSRTASLSINSLVPSSCSNFMETNEIYVNSESLFATVFLTRMENEMDWEEDDTLLVFQEDIEDMVLISISYLNLDVHPNLEDHCQEKAWEVCCLLLGSMIETNCESNEQAEFFCMLVIKPSSDFNAWERIGMLDIRKDNLCCQNMEEREFNLR